MNGASHMRRMMVLILLSLLPVSASWAAYTLKFNTMRVGQENGTVKVVLDLSGPGAMKYFFLSNPKRLVVDLADVTRAGEKAAVDFSNTPIKNIRTGVRNGNDLRMVVELSQETKGRAYTLPPAEDYGHRLVIELDGTKVASRAESVTPAPAKSAVAPVTASQAAPDPVALVSQVEAVPPQMKKEEETEQARDIVIAIDAGHGGVDVGAIGSNGTHEKDVVLQIARRLEDRVGKEPGMTPLMIRDGDFFVSLRDRINKARTYKADMFISIHADAFPDSRARGASVYALSQSGATTEAALMLANRENAADLIGGVSLDDKDELLASVLLDLSQNATIEASLDVAGRVLQGLKRVGKVHKQYVEQAGFVVLKSPDIPSILVETAFISNPNEEANLRSEAYQQRLAEAIIKGVRSYFISNPPQGSRIAAREHVIKRGETLSGIANQYNISPRTLRVTNRLKDDNVRIGQVLQIPLTGS